ncbi:MBL fold metallo-hydrolase [Candidatus Gracilibacteria bacterium]|nr:MBL fold metallo-hydrolase [Candidatus Gracilibacteria bacterium]
MSKAVIKYIGGIDDKDTGKNLTGSQTLFSVDIGKTKNPKIIIDAGAHQGVKNALKINKEISPEVISADFLIITHAHSDHSGLVPYLVKKGFSGQIISTNLTKLQSKVMWLDYVNLTRNEIEKVNELNSKLAKKLSESLAIVNHYEKIKSKSKDSKESKEYLLKIVGDERDFESSFLESKALLKEYGVEEVSDISSVLKEPPELLYDEEDIEIAFNKIECLEYGEEAILQNFKPIMSAKDEDIENILTQTRSGSGKQIAVSSFIKGTITGRLKQLLQKISKDEVENISINKKNEVLRDELTKAFNYVKYIEKSKLSLSLFKNENEDLLNENEDLLEKELKDLESINIGGEKVDVIRLLNFYRGLKFKLPKDINEYLALEKELNELNILDYEDLNRQLPQLPETNYTTFDIKKGLKNSYLTNLDNPNINDFILYIDNIEDIDLYEIISYLKDKKRVFINKKILKDVIVMINQYFDKNSLNIKRNTELKEELYKALDIKLAYEGSLESFQENNKFEYKKAKDFLSSYKKESIIDSLYGLDEVDDLVETTDGNGNSNKVKIYIKRLDDKRIYDVLFNKDKNLIYIFDDKIKQRIKQKLKDKIDEINGFKNLAKKNNSKYHQYQLFVSYYEGKTRISESNYNDAVELLSKHNIKEVGDIRSYYFYKTIENYSQNDIEKLISQIIQTGEDFSYQKIRHIHINNISQEEINQIPYEYQDIFTVFSIKSQLKDEIKDKLNSQINDFYSISNKRRKIRASLKEKLDLFLSWKANYSKLFEINGYDLDGLITTLSTRKQEINLIKEKLKNIKNVKEIIKKLASGKNNLEDFSYSRQLILNHNISCLEDIENCLTPLIQIDYSIEEVKKAISLLKSVHLDKNQDILEDIKLNFVDAGHIEGSAQVVITLVVSQVDNILSQTKVAKKGATKRVLRHYNYGFSGDLGRIKDPNLAGTPLNIPFKLDYLQMESTYAGRVHVDKQKSIKDLINSISTANGKVLIPAFSMQRTQEILVYLLEKRLDSQKIIDEIKLLKKDIKDLELLAFEKGIDNFKKIESLKAKIEFLKTQIFDYDIILDSPTSEAITEIYINHIDKKYSLLNKEIQVKLFGREIIKYVKNSVNDDKDDSKDNNRTSLDEIYSVENRDKKEIIISASGMADGGSIINHLKENLSNPNSKIVFIGYCPLSTKGGKIKSGEEFIIIDGEPFEVKCEYDDITGFSGHIDSEEILMYLKRQNFAKNATIALNHGDEKRLILQKQIEKVIGETSKKIEVLVPNLSENIKLDI